MKKLLALMLAVMLVLSLAACGENTDKPSGDTDKPGTSQTDNQGGEGNNGGNDEIKLSDFSADGNQLDGFELPDVATKYVGTVKKTVVESSTKATIKLKDVSADAFDVLIEHYETNGGTLDEENSTSMEKIYSYDWGTVQILFYELDGEVTINITK